MTGSEVGKKLGNPVNYDLNKNAPQQEQPQQQYKTPAAKVTATGTSTFFVRYNIFSPIQTHDFRIGKL